MNTHSLLSLSWCFLKSVGIRRKQMNLEHYNQREDDVCQTRMLPINLILSPPFLCHFLFSWPSLSGSWFPSSWKMYSCCKSPYRETHHLPLQLTLTETHPNISFFKLCNIHLVSRGSNPMASHCGQSCLRTTLLMHPTWVPFLLPKLSNSFNYWKNVSLLSCLRLTPLQQMSWPPPLQPSPALSLMLFRSWLF